MQVQIINGDSLTELRKLPAESVNCCVTSPPYWGLRDYGVPGQLGMETTPQEFVAKLVAIFSEVWRVLREDGTLWVNLGDSYCPVNRGENARPRRDTLVGMQAAHPYSDLPTNKETIKGIAAMGIKTKDLIGIPWRVAFALQADGWYLRSDIIWAKPNPMPESVTDRPTKSHEYIFLLSKSERYYYDCEAVKEPAVSDHSSGNGFAGRQGGAEHLPMGGGLGSTEPWRPKGKGGKNAFRGQGHFRELESARANRGDRDLQNVGYSETRNKRSVWSVATKPYKDAHFATYPPDLIKPCILAGCPVGGTVLDPFGGSGTTAATALELGRNAVTIELNPEYVKLIEQRTRITPSLPLC